MIQLDVGGGNYALAHLPGENHLRDAKTLAEWTTVDPFKTANPNTIIAPAWKIPLPDGSCGVIASSHALEHISHRQTVETLHEWYRLLAPGGFLYLVLPDFRWCVDQWRAAPEDHPEKYGWLMHIIFGLQDYEGDTHKTGFTSESVRRNLIAAGFDAERVEISERMCPIDRTLGFSMHSQGEVVTTATKAPAVSIPNTGDGAMFRG